MRKSLPLVFPLLCAVTVACTQNTFNSELGEQPTLEQAVSDNSTAIKLFGSDGTGVPLLIRSVYDQNRNGHSDPGEVLLGQSGFRLTHLNTQGARLEASEIQVTPKANGRRWQGLFVNLPPGRYQLERIVPLPSGVTGLIWAETRPAAAVPIVIDLNAQVPVRAVEFPSVCLEAGVAVALSAGQFENPNCAPKFDLAPKISGFTLSPNEVLAGETPQFSWTVTDKADLEIDEGIGVLASLAGSLDVLATDSARYTLTAKNAFATSQAQASLKVRLKPVSGAFSRAGGTPASTEPVTSGSLFVSVPGIRLANGTVVVGKTPVALNANSGPLQARIQGLHLYDPASSTFSALGTIRDPNDTSNYVYSLEDAVPLEAGKALLRKIPAVFSASATREYEIYDFSNDQHTPITGPAGPISPDYVIRQVVQNNTLTLIIGCYGRPLKLRTESFDLKSKTVTKTNCVNDPEDLIAYSDFTPLADGTLLVTGGADYTDKVVATARIFDPKTGVLRKISSMNFARYQYTTTGLNDGRILFSGGSSEKLTQRYVKTAEIFDPKTERFSAVGDLLEGRLEHRTFRLPSGKILLLGSSHLNDPTAKTIFAPELFDPLSGQFSSTGAMLEPRSGFSAIQLLDGRVFVYGGNDRNGLGLSSAEIYTP
jgi:hypothetical protein